MNSGLVIASFGRHVLVETLDGRRLICHPRGKKNQAVVGDRIQWLPSGDEGTVECIEERRNLLYRQDDVRTKVFAANVDQVLVLLAAQPTFSEGQLARALIAAHAQDITPLIALNKSDLAESYAAAWTRLQPYRDMGYTVLPLAAKPEVGQPNTTLLSDSLQRQTTVVLGLSGVGKSSLINALVPGAAVQTAVLSQALRSGQHTTTCTTWYWLDADHTTALIDTPGFQGFGLQHIAPMQLTSYMPDIAAHATQCKFHNCTHLHEPGCGVIAEVKSGTGQQTISANRYRLYSEIFTDLS